ncbi:MAG: DEAD/DEAH box helicase [Methylovulum miyakonense]|uniref:DEAD/DEAH box helicase n=1 Tax=Methylovulum miyakonense TaxID=645578 RepID=UPI003BB76641
MINLSEIRKQLKSKLWVADPFKLLSGISNICSANTDLGRELVIRALENRDELAESYQNILDELVMQVGLYPYVYKNTGLQNLSLRSAINHSAHRADGVMQDCVLHSAQARVLRKLMAGESIILSAPTSFGKSLFIDITISAKNFKNIVLIVPTLALVEETRRRMTRFIDRYSIITTINQEQGEQNIFVFTQERFLSMINEIPEVDFFVIDEFYKLSISNEGDRATQLNQAFLRLSNSNAQFYLLGPSIRAIPDIVIEKTGCSFLFEDFQTVAIELHQLAKKPNKEEALIGLLDKIDGQTMIYCQSPASTRKLLKKYLELSSIELSQDNELIEAAQWTATHYHDQWLVSIALKHGIGIHHGRLPRSLGRFMVRAFEEGKLKILLCTSTLIEGVNTAAKNVIVYDNKLNNKSLDFFTFNNIRGRSGRMFRHFIGHVYVFDAPPQEELPYVDVPALNPTEKTPSSLLIQLQQSDVPESLKEKVDKILNQKILPVELLKNISCIEPEYLLDTAQYLLDLNVRELEQCSWSSRPLYENIKFTSEIIWTQLGGKTAASHSAMRSSNMMTQWIWDLYKTRNLQRFRREKIQSLINYNKSPKSPDDAVEDVLAFLRGWASFNYPKYLIALSETANHILTVRGLKGCNYLPFASSIECLFQPSSFSSLEEYGLPTEISEKFIARGVFNKDDSLDVVVNTLRSHQLNQLADGIFEKRIIEDFQKGIGVK